MSTTSYTQIAREGIWNANPAFVQILGICPTLAVTTSVVSGLGLGLATLLAMAASSVTVSLFRNTITSEIRIPVFVLIIASVVTAIELAMNAFLHDLYTVLGIFIPLIVTNCIVLARVESFAYKQPPLRALADGVFMGLGMTLALVSLGALREAIGQGTLFANAHLMFGAGAEWMTMTLVEDYRGFLFAILPPGAFIGLGLLIAAKNMIDKRMAERAARSASVAHHAQPAH